ncbi:hypothetical protein HYH03_006892 [Edaphochlamys debaryana]|uniref:Uncharacterized protein n=1 Tax=Edaphochlamys debaryana TaxID=47281 RepID=A0A835Y1Q9_9CHLO|nr:hypothetical protein HYH03_006892 [Edaphochlamys debaryana]|eukprot:KAG2494957.1 hypothetical protein HYH03_006892 [Edaphochlamys debaryana]
MGLTTTTLLVESIACSRSSQLVFSLTLGLGAEAQVAAAAKAAASPATNAAVLGLLGPRLSSLLGSGYQLTAVDLVELSSATDGGAAIAAPNTGPPGGQGAPPPPTDSGTQVAETGGQSGSSQTRSVGGNVEAGRQTPSKAAPPMLPAVSSQQASG